MCGRYTLFLEQADLEERFDARFSEPFSPRYNMAPGQELPVIRADDPERFRHLEWGFIPDWAEDDTDRLINARAETVSTKPSFREAYENPGKRDGSKGTVQAGRCLVPANGFYEWVETDDGKQPFRVAFEDDRPFAMAGLWTRWEPSAETTQTGLDAFGGGSSETDDEPEGPRETFTVVTTEPNDLIGEYHHRMAAILEPGREREWLSAADPSSLLQPSQSAEMRAYPVSTAVNSPAVDEPSLVDPLE
ncbi:SOS response-associated peptidase [Natrialbaceae archaeon A-chndr2]